jgi:hypothetical protein
MRNSPSGPLAVSDEVGAMIVYDQSSQPAAPGDFYVAVVGGVAGAFIPVADPLAAKAFLITGVKTRAGRILRARISLLADQATSGNGDIDFQWLVNNKPVGNVVTLKWADGAFFADTSTLTPDQVIAGNQQSNKEVDFGEPAWVAGDIVVLKAVVKSPIAASSKAIIPFSYETTYEH